MQNSACLVDNPITVNNIAFLFNYTSDSRASDSMMDPTLSYFYYYYFFKLGIIKVLSVTWSFGVQGFSFAAVLQWC